jgi:hypothetical protein
MMAEAVLKVPEKIADSYVGRKGIVHFRPKGRRAGRNGFQINRERSKRLPDGSGNPENFDRIRVFSHEAGHYLRYSWKISVYGGEVCGRTERSIASVLPFTFQSYFRNSAGFCLRINQRLTPATIRINPVKPAAPKTIQVNGNSGNSSDDTGGNVVVVVSGFVRTWTGVTGRVVTLVVDSDFICCLIVAREVSVGSVVGAAAPLRVTAKYENPEVVAT